MLGSKGMSPADLEGFSSERLRQELKNSKEELFKLRFQAATGQLANNARLWAVRVDLARIYTIMRERELGIRLEAATLGDEKTADMGDNA